MLWSVFDTNTQSLPKTGGLLDLKAQATAAIAGALLAALFALKAWEGSNVAKFASVGLVFLLLASIGCCLWAMRVTSFQMPPSGADTYTTIKAYLDLQLDTQQLRKAKQDTVRWFAEEWIGCNDRLHECNQRKAERIACAHLLLGGAAVLVAAAVLMRTFGT